jgi:Gamma tubulin complex component N-terminal
MQHEVLAACLGYPGNIIRDEEKVSGAFRVSAAAANSFLSKAEVEIINKTVKLGFQYRLLQRFSKGQPLQHTAAAAPTAQRDSLYLRALRAAVEEVLIEYGSRVARTEQELLQDSSLPLSYIYHSLRDYLPGFEAMAAVCQSAQTVRGGQLLLLLYSQSRFGAPAVRARLLRLLWHCHQVFTAHTTCATKLLNARAESLCVPCCCANRCSSIRLQAGACMVY